MSNPNIKPCPFCGGEATLWKRNGRYGTICFVKCDVCGAQTGVTACNEPVESEEWNDAGLTISVNKWNAREDEREVTNE